jgi:glyoxylase-like metal-dependent hydrolase (beta-lactamase superfamily II)
VEKHTRRSFLRKGALATAVIGTAAGCAAPDVQRVENAGVSGWLDQQAPGFYRLRLGDFRVTVLSDGTAPRDLPKIMSKPAEVAEILEASHEVLPIELSINCFLVDTGVQKVLVDTGAGELFGATSGSLVENLRHAGYRPEDVDVVLLTHFHGDHSGGLSIGGRMVFPNAMVYVDKKDPDYWFDATAEADAPADRK